MNEGTIKRGKVIPVIANSIGIDLENTEWSDIPLEKRYSPYFTPDKWCAEREPMFWFVMLILLVVYL